MNRIGLIIFFILLPFLGNAHEDCNNLIKQAVKAYQKGEHNLSLELLAKAKSIAEETNSYDCLFLVFNNIGNNYNIMLDYGEALNFYMKAYDVAANKLDDSRKITVLNNIAILFSNDGKLDKAEEYFKKAYQLAKRKIKKGTYAINLGELNNVKQEWEKAKSYFEEAVDLVSENPDLLSKANAGFAKILIELGDKERAEKLLVSLLPPDEKKYLNNQDISSLFYLAKIEQERVNHAEAIKLLQRALQTNGYDNYRIEIYNLLSQLYAETKSYEKALIAKDSAAIISLRVSKIKATKLFEINKVKFQLLEYKKEKKEYELRVKTQKTVILIIIVAAVIIISLVLLLYRTSRLKNKQQKIAYDHNQRIMTLELEKKKQDNMLLEQKIQEKETLALLEKEKLKNEIELKNRKLSAKALYLSNRNNLINDIISNFEKQDELKEIPSLKKTVKELKNLIRSDDEWGDFIQHFEEVNQGFLFRLKENHPNLNSNDIRYVSYIYMNLSTKEISSILNITLDACRKRKERISKKLNLSGGKNLFAYLSAI